MAVGKELANTYLAFGALCAGLGIDSMHWPDLWNAVAPTTKQPESIDDVVNVATRVTQLAHEWELI